MNPTSKDKPRDPKLRLERMQMPDQVSGFLPFARERTREGGHDHDERKW